MEDLEAEALEEVEQEEAGEGGAGHRTRQGARHLTPGARCQAQGRALCKSDRSGYKYFRSPVPCAMSLTPFSDFSLCQKHSFSILQ